MNTPKALANFSPGFEHRENPGNKFSNRHQTLKGLDGWQTLSGLNDYLISDPRVVAERSNPGLKLANAFGVILGAPYIISNCIVGLAPATVTPPRSPGVIDPNRSL